MVDPVLRLGQVTAAVFDEIEVMVGLGDGRLEIGDEGVAERNGPSLLDFRSPTVIAPWATTCAPAAVKLAKPSVTKCASRSSAEVANLAKVAPV